MTEEISIVDVAWGRKLLVNSMVKVLLMSALVIYFYVSLHGLGTLPPRIVRFVLTLLLMIWLYRGSSVAKWLCIVLYGIAGIMMLVRMPLDNLWACLILGSMSFVFLEMTYRLLCSRDVKGFLRFQRAGPIPHYDEFA